MSDALARILVVDDSAVNRRLLVRALEIEGYEAESAADGEIALTMLRDGVAVDAVLLDLIMPGRDGYEVLAEIKHDDALRHLPVIVITGVEEVASIVRCIELGAVDYLPKPFNSALLRARLGACLAEKRLRDLEREYLEQVGRVTAAAAEIEAGIFEPAALEQVVGRTDALGQLARVFQQMAREVQQRERRLRQQLQQVLLDVEERRRADAETVAVYIPMDRRHALVAGASLPAISDGAALFVDVSGFTGLTVALSRDLGLQRGVEELIRHLNRVFDSLISSVHRHSGSAIAFAGDAMTCWFAGDDGRRATAAAFEMIDRMVDHASVTTPVGTVARLAIKVSVVAGTTRRFLVGDPEIQRFEVLVGDVLDDLARAERLATEGDVLVDPKVAAAAAAELEIAGWREHVETGRRFAVVTRSGAGHPEAPWPELATNRLAEELARPWLAPTVFERVRTGKTAFLSELRPAAALFLSFTGIGFESDPEAGERLDALVRWVQTIIAHYDGTLLQLTIGDKGSYLYATFGAPAAHEDDPVRAVAAALELKSVPRDLEGVTVTGIGVAYGQMRAGAYGGAEQRTYGVQGAKTNLAAYLMQHADGDVLCDEAIYEAARGALAFAPMPPMRAKGSDALVAVYRPTSTTLGGAVKGRFDRLSAGQQLVLKISSVIGATFTLPVLEAIYPVEQDRPQLPALLAELEAIEMLTRRDDEAGTTFAFRDVVTREHAYQLLLFAQRRQLHRSVAEWHEQDRAGQREPLSAMLAQHWKHADDPARAIHYLEEAGQYARACGDFDEAERYFRESLLLETESGVLSSDFRPGEAPLQTMA